MALTTSNLRPRTSACNAICERLNGTLRRDCLDHIIMRDDVHADRVLKEYVRYYHGRPHCGLRMQPPPRLVEADRNTDLVDPDGGGDILARLALRTCQMRWTVQMFRS